LLRSLKLRTKLAMIVAIPMIAALAIAVPGFRSRRHDLDAVSSARAQLQPATKVLAYLGAIQDEASLSAWWVASADPKVKPRLEAARAAADRAARALPAAASAAAAHGAPDAAGKIQALDDSINLLGQERQFVDLRIAPDESVLGYYRDLGSETTSAIDAFVRAPKTAVAVTMFRDLATLARLESGAADERSILSVAYSRLQLTDPLAADLVAAVTLQDASASALQGQGRAPTRAIVNSGLREFQSATDQVRQRRASALTTRVLAFAVTPAQWYASASQQMAGWGDIQHRLEQSIVTGLRDREHHARLVLWYYAIGALIALLLAGVLAYLVARAIRRPLRQLADNAHDVADRQLPALVDALNDDTVVPPTITPLTVRSRDELGALAKAFNHVERTTVEVAELQRQAVRSGISDLYVHLARRNQPLLTRQLSLIEDLERGERDADRLGTLFTLDHLATRMRRNSDSLLVLAGQDDLLSDPVPVPLLDVVRGAVSETADFERIDTAGIPGDIEVVGYAAPDLAHAVSELLENATAFSPPASRVVVVARRTGAGIELTISDEGIGIAADRLEALNETLTRPPLPGLALSRSLGLIVVARLAHRIGVEVTLRSAPEVGTAAVLLLPASILRASGSAETVADALDAEAPVPVGTEIRAAEAPTDAVPPEVWVVPEPDPAHATAGPVDIDLTADETADAVTPSDAPATSTDPWTRPGARPVAPPVPGALDTGPRDADADEIDLLPRRGRHHRRRRPHRGAGDATTEPTAEAPTGGTDAAPLLPPALPGRDASTDPTAAAGDVASTTPPPPSPPPLPGAPATAVTSDDEDEVTSAGLPRRTPHPSASREASLAAAPPPRPPDAVFELVARYEAGRRRAGTRPTDAEDDE
jgi:signal transduction histidine kinase